MREPKQPDCGECGLGLVCPDCNDTRPTADKLYAGWRFMSPFGRWETAEKVEQPDQYGPVIVWTKETGDQVPWKFPRWRKMDARAPEMNLVGDAEIRVVEYEWRDGAIVALATLDTSHVDIFDTDAVLVMANFKRGEGWTVSHHVAPGTPPTVWPAKAKARSEVKRLAREYAKKMGVKVRVVAPTRG